jgi:hypothetical protein
MEAEPHKVHVKKFQPARHFLFPMPPFFDLHIPAM